MLSIANLSSSGAASSYYELDDYYAKDSEEHKSLSSWHGKGATSLGLKGQVEPSSFKAILDGKLPNGQSLGRIENGERVHAPGIDLTFSAPKSVSIMAEVGGDKRIYDVHMQAVKTALNWTEKNAIGTRAMKDGVLENEKVGNITAALFRHDTSRNMDPQLHTHSVIANAIKRDDGEWRSAYMKGIFDNKMFIGQLYRTELAKGMNSLGYHINPTHNDGRFELKEVPKDVISAFSSRSKDIREALKGFDYVNAKTASAAALGTRSSKQEIDRDLLKEKWSEISKNYGFDVKDVAKQVGEGSYKLPEPETKETYNLTTLEKGWEKFLNLIGRPVDENKMTYHGNDNVGGLKGVTSDKAVRFAIERASERSSVFSDKDLQKSAMGYGIGKVSFEQVEKSMERLQKSGELLEGSKKDGITYFTTKELLQSEKQVVKYMKDGKNSISPILPTDKAKSAIEATTLKVGQKGAANHILTSQDRVTGIQGYAGVGKTYMMQKVNEIAHKQGFELVGMAPSASAANTLQEDAGIKSQTIHQFLYKYDGVVNDRESRNGLQEMRADFKNKVLVLDESSLASTKQVESLLKISNKLGSRVVMLGDSKQLGAVEAGKPFAQLQDNKMSTFVLNDIIRQKEGELKDAVMYSIEGNVYKALDKLGENVIETKNVEQKAAEMWLDSEKRDSTLVLAPSNSSRTDINETIRDGLKSEGVIKADSEQKFEQLLQKSLTGAELRNPQSYKEGDVVIFNKDFKRHGIAKNDSLTVKSVDHNYGVVSFKNTKGNEDISWRPDSERNADGKAAQIYGHSEITLGQGDKVVWKKNDRANGLINSNTATVTKISGDKVTFDLGKKGESTFNKNDPAIRYIDYAYAVTAHSAQGKTTDNVIAVAKSNEKFLTNQQTFYVEISRAKQEAMFIVDDKQKVAEQLSEATGEKISAMENQGLKYEGESPFDKIDKEMEQAEKEFEQEQKLNSIERVDEDKRPEILEKEEVSNKSFEEFSKEFLANNKMQLSEKGQEIVSNIKEQKAELDYSKM